MNLESINLSQLTAEEIKQLIVFNNIHAIIATFAVILLIVLLFILIIKWLS